MTRTEIEADIQKITDSGDLAGAATLAWRSGDEAPQVFCAGWRDLETKLPVEPDTIFRIASLTKPITSVAALMLVDEGRMALTDPVTRFAPEFSHMRVLRAPNGSLDDTDPAERLITIEDLLTHRSGITYGAFHQGPIAQAYRDGLGADFDSELSPDEWIARLAKLPLIGQPGSAMYYGGSTDLLGFLIARIEGAPLVEVLRRRIFEPLGMPDTSFFVPPEKRSRRAAAYGFDEAGHLARRNARSGVYLEERHADTAYESGGAGLWSTVGDYLRFARVFLGDGAVEGVRLLRPETLAAMMTNQLTDSQRRDSVFLGQRPFASGRGFGFGVAMVLERDNSDFMRRGSVGTVSWPGAFGGWWQADPKEGSVLIFLAHNMVDLEQMATGIGLGVWAAIEKFSRFGIAGSPS